jgi:hypothetical protein
MNILDQANELVNGDRQDDYGDPHTNHQRIADLWTTYIEGSASDRDGISERVVNATDAAVMMILVKVARLMQSPNHRDTWVDIAGYAEVGSRCAEKDYGNRTSTERD